MAADAKEIANSVVILDPIEAARRDPPGIERLARIRTGEKTFDPAGYRSDFGLRGDRLSGRRHLAGIELCEDLFPDLGLLFGAGLARVSREVKAGHGNVTTVTAITFCGKERLNDFLKWIVGRNRRRSFRSGCGFGSGALGHQKSYPDRTQRQ